MLSPSPSPGRSPMPERTSCLACLRQNPSRITKIQKMVKVPNWATEEPSPTRRSGSISTALGRKHRVAIGAARAFSPVLRLGPPLPPRDQHDTLEPPKVYTRDRDRRESAEDRQRGATWEEGDSVVIESDDGESLRVISREEYQAEQAERGERHSGDSPRTSRESRQPRSSPR